MADFIIDPNYAIASGLQITHSGGKLRFPNDKGLFEEGLSTNENLYDLRLQYLEIPVALKLKTNPINDLTYWGQFGTYLGVNIGARLNATVDGKPEFVKEKIREIAEESHLAGLIDQGTELKGELNFKGSFRKSTEKAANTRSVITS